MKTKTTEQYLREGYSLFIDKEIPKELFEKYINDSDGKAIFELQSWIIDNLKDHIAEWCTGIGVIEAVEHLVKEAYNNGNIKLSDYETTRFHRINYCK